MTKKENIASNLLDLVGNTPLIQLNSITKGSHAEIVAKLESFNPGSSVKDRIGLSMINKAEENGMIAKGATIIEPTSGNTGIGLAIAAAVKGYRIILVMPESMSVERRKLLIALGAELVLTDANQGMEGAIDQAQVLSDKISGSFIPRQFENMANPDIHYKTTGPEIWKDTAGRVDYFVSGVGTGGTVSGVGRYLKEQNKDVKIIAVEPEESSVISGNSAGPHMIQGIGAGFIPKTLNTDIIDEVYKVSSQTAIDTAKQLAREEGILAGISSGAAVAAALCIAADKKNEGKRIVTLLPDTGERYISTLLFYED